MPADRLYRALRLRKERGWLAILTPRALRVDISILDRYSWQKRMAYPSYDTLQRETGLSRASVREALRELAFYGLWEIIRITRREGGGTRRFNVYRLPPGLVPDAPSERYVPSNRFTHTQRPSTLGEQEGDSSVAYTAAIEEDKGRQSRVLDRGQSSVLNNHRSSSLDGNHAVNNVSKPRSKAQNSFHSPEERASPNGEGPRKSALAAPPASGDNSPRIPRAVSISSDLGAELAARKAWRMIQEGADQSRVIEALAKHLGCPFIMAELLLARVTKRHTRVQQTGVAGQEGARAEGRG